MMTRLRGETAEIQSLDQIPPGMTEDEMDQYWETHSLGDELLDQMEPFPDDFPLPPRSEAPGSRPAEPEHSEQTVPVGKIVLGVGLVFVGFLAGAYVAYRLAKAGADVSGFLPTKYPNFKISPAVGGAIATAGAAKAAFYRLA
jgi:hypothetical protein